MSRKAGRPTDPPPPEGGIDVPAASPPRANDAGAGAAPRQLTIRERAIAAAAAVRAELAAQRDPSGETPAPGNGGADPPAGVVSPTLAHTTVPSPHQEVVAGSPGESKKSPEAPPENFSDQDSSDLEWKGDPKDDPAFAQRLELLRIRRARMRRYETNRLMFWRPHPKQLEFHEAGARYRERMLKAGNQQGKTLCAGMEIAMHLTGRYPDWWKGRRFSKPTTGWAAGVTGESTRDNPQRILMGRIGSLGTGTIPLECLSAKRITWARGVPDQIDTVLVKHVSGGYSTLQFKSYEKGREKWQGETLDWIWFDEEPPMDIYTEGITRTNTTGGPVLITYTPLLGMSSVTLRYLKEGRPDCFVTSMTLRDALHYKPEEMERIAAQYPEHEREARVNGVPMMGEGRVFPLSKEAVHYDHFEFPDHFRRIVGLDFGWTHPTAAVWCAFDPESDTIYIYDCYRKDQASVIIHASVIRSRGAWIPVAWPKDGNNETAAGENLAKQYGDEKVNMLHEYAHYLPTHRKASNSHVSLSSIEAGVLDMLGRMQTGRLKVAAHLSDWWEEFLLYHREEGKIVDVRDDLMSATRYAVMMLRHATTHVEKKVVEGWRKKLKKARPKRSAMAG